MSPQELIRRLHEAPGSLTTKQLFEARIEAGKKGAQDPVFRQADYEVDGRGRFEDPEGDALAARFVDGENISDDDRQEARRAREERLNKHRQTLRYRTALALKQRPQTVDVVAPRTDTRVRGAGRPAARSTRSSARSGDSPDDAEPAEPSAALPCPRADCEEWNEDRLTCDARNCSCPPCDHEACRRPSGDAGS